MNRMQVDADIRETYYRDIAKTSCERYFPEGLVGMMFLNCVAYFDFDTCRFATQPIPITPEWVSWKRCQEELELAQTKFILECGKISQDISDKTITHVVMNHKDLTHFRDLLDSIQRPEKPRFVVLEWINDSYQQETLLNEPDYNPKSYKALENLKRNAPSNL